MKRIFVLALLLLAPTLVRAQGNLHARRLWLDDSLGHSQVMVNPTLDSTRNLIVPKVPTGFSNVPTGFVVNGTSTNIFLQWNNVYRYWQAVALSTMDSALLPSQGSNAGKFLSTDGMGNLSWQACCVSSVFGRSGSVNAQTGDYNFSQITGTLPIAQGGTGQSTRPAALLALVPDTTGQTSKALEVIPGGGIGWQPVAGGGTVTNVATGTGLTGGPITATGTVSLANTAVTPGVYTNSNITVDAQGRITAAANGAGGGGGTPANPTATIGTAAVNGTATTYMRSDAAPAFGNLTGDVTSTGMATSVVKILGNTVPANASGVLTNNGSGTLTWGAGGGGGTVSNFSVAATPAWLSSSVANPTTTPALTLSATTGQTANSFLASPNGSTGALSVRAIVASDVPTLNQNTTGTASNVTGVVAVANGGSGATTLLNHGVLLGSGAAAVGVTAVGTTGQVLTGVTGANPVWGAVPLSPFVAAFPSAPTDAPTASTTGQALSIGDGAHVNNSLNVGLGTPDGHDITIIGQGKFSPFEADAANTDTNSHVVTINGVASAGGEIAIGTGPRDTTGYGLNGNPATPIFSGTQRGSGSGSQSIAMGTVLTADLSRYVGSGSYGEHAVAINAVAGTSSFVANGFGTGEYVVHLGSPGHAGDDRSANGSISLGNENTLFHGFPSIVVGAHVGDFYVAAKGFGDSNTYATGYGATVIGGYGIRANGYHELWGGDFNTPTLANPAGNLHNDTAKYTDALLGIGNGTSSAARSNIFLLQRDTVLTIGGLAWTARNDAHLLTSAIKSPGGTTQFLRADGSWQVPAGGGGGSGSVNSGVAGNLAWYVGTGTAVDGNVNVNASAGALTLGVSGTTIGKLAVSGNTSGAITIAPQAAAGTYNFNLPTSAGTAGQPLLSGGGGSTAMTFGTLGVTGGGNGLSTATTGGIRYASATNVLSELPAGTNGQVLSMVSGLPAWAAAGGTLQNWIAVSGTSPTTVPVVGASSVNQIAIGNKAVTTGTYDNAVAIGQSNCSGTNATALNNVQTGYAAPAVDHFSAVAIGQNCGSQGNSATNINSPGSTLTGTGSFTIGGYGGNSITGLNAGNLTGSAHITGENSVNVGGGTSNGATLPNWIAADQAVTLGGWSDTIRGFGGVIAGGVGNSILDGAFGGYGTADCFVTGAGNIAAARYQTVCGAFNIQRGTSGAYDPTTALFIVGNGTANNARSNALEVDGNGNATLGGTINLPTGTNLPVGTGTLASGTVTITNSLVTSTTFIEVTDNGGGVLANIGALYVSAQSAGSFTVKSSNAIDNSTFKYLLIQTH